MNCGSIRINASDDGINGSDGSAGNVEDMGMPPTTRGGGFRPDPMTSAAEQGTGFFAGGGNSSLTINGGYIAVTASGDGIDINGTIVMTNGTIIVHGPVVNMNGAIDYDGTFKMGGGVLIAAGSAGMAQAPGTTSTQNSLFVNFSSLQQANAIVHLESSDGTGIVSFAPNKQYRSFVLSSPALTNNSTYNLYIGGGSAGTATDGVYHEGTYTPGTKYAGFTISSIVTMIR